MKTVYLVVVTPDLRQVAIVHGGKGWRLPRWDRLKRIPPASGTNERLPLEAYVRPTDIVHWAPLPPRDVSDTSGSYYCLAVATEHPADRHDGHRNEHVLTECEYLLSDNTLTAQEQLAVRMALSRLEAPAVMFDSPADVSAAIAWARRQIDKTGARITSVARYRQNRRELIARFETSTGGMYLKAGKERFADEAILTQHLHALLPRHIPETVAEDRRHHRWLYRELPGVMMASVPLKRHTIVAAVRALVSLQQVTLGSDVVARHVAPRRQTATELFRVVDAYVERAWCSVQPSSPLAPVVGAWRTLREAMVRACTAVDQLEVPSVLVPSDFWSQNIIVTLGDGIGLIDLGHSYWSSPVLPLWRFVRNVKHLWPLDDPAARASIRQDVGDAFVGAWAPMISPRVMTRLIAQMWLIGRLFGIQIAAYDLDLYEEAVGTNLPPGYRATRLAERVRDLSQAFAQHMVAPRFGEPELAAALDL